MVEALSFTSEFQGCSVHQLPGRGYKPGRSARSAFQGGLAGRCRRATQFLNLTSAPVLIQIGTADDYDNGTEPCRALANTVNPSNNNVVALNEYPGAYHAWDRLMIPATAPDPFADHGSFFTTGRVPTVRIVPDVEQAYLSRKRVVQFFRRHL